ncbi:hypothetical protein KHQ89_05600 [Mycoplasmatota bacterium]|nr:hypothetical protein KHQ89_05600 [Mycoplasmatota bacterium]
MKVKRIILSFLVVLIIILLNGCEKAELEENINLERLKEMTMSNDEQKSSSTIASFTIDELVEESSSKFNFFDLITNHMVLQANATVRIFGKYETDGPIALSIDDVTYYEEVINGSFEFYIGPFNYGGPYTIKFYTKEFQTKIDDVLFGEVFLMSGQSNMAITMSEILKSATVDYKVSIEEDIYENDYDQIRFNTIGTLSSREEKDNFTPNQVFSWDSLSSDNAYGLSAFSFYYAKTLYEEYKVPIGIVISAVGATYTNTWIPSEEAKEMDQTYVKNVSDETHHHNTLMG